MYIVKISAWSILFCTCNFVIAYFKVIFINFFKRNNLSYMWFELYLLWFYRVIFATILHPVHWPLPNHVNSAFSLYDFELTPLYLHTFPLLCIRFQWMCFDRPFCERTFHNNINKYIQISSLHVPNISPLVPALFCMYFMLHNFSLFWICFIFQWMDYENVLNQYGTACRCKKSTVLRSYAI